MNQIFCTTYVLLFLLISAPSHLIGQPPNSEITEKVQNDWLAALNNRMSLDSFYSEKSGILINDQLFIGTAVIHKQLQALIKNVQHFHSYNLIEKYQLRAHQKFALGAYRTSSGAIYSSIIAWSYKDRWTKDFEVFYINSASPDSGIEAVHRARAQWEHYSNQHRPDLIVDAVFSKNGKYFYQGKEFQNHHIIDAYSYMSNESYKIKLESLNTSQINNDIIYDIGTFDAGGRGLYTLIWKKELDDWKLLLDFNF